MFESLLYRFLGDTTSFDAAVARVQGKLNNMAGQATKAGLALTATFGLTAAGALTLAGNLEQTTVAFETMLGSADMAADTLARLREFAETTPFELPGIIAAARGLLLFGERGEGMMDTLKIIGNAAAGTGADFAELTSILNKVRGSGVMLTDDFRMLAERGVISMQDLAAHFGTTTAEAQAMISTGQVGFDDLRAVIAKLSAEGGRFNNLMEKQSGTFQGLLSTLKDGIAAELTKIGQTLLPMATRGVQAAMWLVEAFAALPSWVQASVAVIIGLGAVLGPVLLGFGAMAISISGLITLYGTLAGAAAAASAALVASVGAFNAAMIAAMAMNAALGLGVLGVVALVGAVAVWAQYKLTMGGVNDEIARSIVQHERLAKVMSGMRAEQMAAIEAAPNRGVAVGLADDAIEQTRAELKGLQAQKAAASRALIEAQEKSGGIGGAAAAPEQTAAAHQLEMVNKRYEQQIQHLKDLKARRDELAQGPADATTNEAVLASTQAYIQSLRDEAAAIGKTTEELKLLELARQNVGPTLLAEAKAAQEALAARKADIKAKEEERDAIAANVKDYNEYIAGLRMARETMGMSSERAELYRRSLEGLDPVLVKLAENEIKLNEERRAAAEEEKKIQQDRADRMGAVMAAIKAKQDKDKSDAASLTDSMKTPYEKAQEALAKYNDWLARGLITQETYNRAIADLATTWQTAAGAARQYFAERNNTTREFDTSMQTARFGAEAVFGATGMAVAGGAGEPRDAAAEKLDTTNTKLDDLLAATRDNKPLPMTVLQALGATL
jgi:tape measure domain-containing protein